MPEGSIFDATRGQFSMQIDRGVDNEKVPLVGNDFEMANFTNEEIAFVLSEVLGKEITFKKI